MATGKILGFILRLVFEFDDAECFEGTTATFATADARNFERKDNVVEHAIVCVHEEALEDKTEFFVAEAVELAVLKFTSIAPIERNLALGRFVEERQKVHQRRFTGAGFADDCDRFPALDI